jgi:hypothetical protein
MCLLLLSLFEIFEIKKAKRRKYGFSLPVFCVFQLHKKRNTVWMEEICFHHFPLTIFSKKRGEKMTIEKQSEKTSKTCHF